jgi:histidyl-tRNA synthetase
MTHASKVADYAAVIDENEVKSGVVYVKNLETGEQMAIEENFAA